MEFSYFFMCYLCKTDPNPCSLHLNVVMRVYFAEGNRSLCSCVGGAVRSGGAEMSLGSERAVQLPQAMCEAARWQQRQMLCLVQCLAFWSRLILLPAFACLIWNIRKSYLNFQLLLNNILLSVFFLFHFCTLFLSCFLFEYDPATMRPKLDWPGS